MKRVCIATLTILAAAVTVLAAPTVAGTWTMTVEGSPHGNATMGLSLKQEGTKVTGTFSSGHSADVTVSGEFANGELKIETAGDADSKIVFTGKLKDEGTLAGVVSSPMGDMKWTATRVQERKK